MAKPKTKYGKVTVKKIKFDKGVKMPFPRQLSKWEDMQVGDSVFCKTEASFKYNLNSLYYCIHNFKPTWKIAARNVIENGKAGKRIWRLK